MSDYNYSISLRVTHPNIDPDEITKELGIEPFRKWMAGERRMTPKGTLLEGLNSESYWASDMHPETNRLLSIDVYIEDYLIQLNNKLNRHKEYFTRLLASGGCVEYFVGWFAADNVGLTLSRELMKQTAELGIEIGLCAYVGDE